MINSSLSVPGRITAITIEKECGKHSNMKISILPDRIGGITELRNFINYGVSVEADIDGTLVMCGKIRKVIGKSTYSGAAVSVFIVSDSMESDMIKTSRIFQSPKKTYGEIVGKISNDIVFTIVDQELASKKEKEVVIQYNESDFAFANRIANENHTRLFVMDYQRGKNKIIIANDMQFSKNLENNDIISAELNLSDNREILEIEYREYIELGTKVKIENNEYVVISLKVDQKGDGVRYFYKIEHIIKNQEEDKSLLDILSLGTAKVINNKDSDNLGRIQVEFSDLEDSMNDDKIWIPYISTFTAGEGGVFFVPDVDEQVQILCQNGKCYAYGCVRQQAVSDKINNTDCKSIMIYNKTLVIEDKKITLVAGDYTAQIDEEEACVKNSNYHFKLNKDSMVVGNSNNTVTVDKNKIEINLNKKGIITAKDNIIQISVNNKGKLEVTDKMVKSVAESGIISLESGKLSIEASSNVDVTTAKMNVK